MQLGIIKSYYQKLTAVLNFKSDMYSVRNYKVILSKLTAVLNSRFDMYSVRNYEVILSIFIDDSF